MNENGKQNEILQVKARVRCEECAGTGELQHPLWVEFRRVFKDLDDPAGMETLRETWFQKQGLECAPDEVGPCWECGGDRFVEAWVRVYDLHEHLSPVELPR